MDGINYTGDLPRYVLDRLFDNLTNLTEMLTIGTMVICSNNHSRDQVKISIGVFSIAFVMLVIEKFTELLNTLTTKYKLRNKCWTNTVNDSICASLSLLIILLPKYYYVPIRKIKLCC